MMRILADPDPQHWFSVLVSRFGHAALLQYIYRAVIYKRLAALSLVGLNLHFWFY
jgi:hypothetical protein